MKLASIILPTRNSARFLDARISSIIGQNYPRFEVLAIDGESSDGTMDRLQKWASMDSRVKVFTQQALGPYQAINLGLSQAQGEVLYIATSDDTMERGLLSDALEVFDRCPEAGILHIDIDIIDECGRVLGVASRQTAANGYFGSWNRVIHSRCGRAEFHRNLVIPSPYRSLTEVVLTRKAIGGSRFDPTIGLHADVMWLAEVVKGTRVVHLPSVLATWRKHRNQLTSKQPEELWKAHDDVVARITSECVADGVDVARAYRFRNLLADYLGRRCGGAFRARARHPATFLRELFVRGIQGSEQWHINFFEEARRIIPLTDLEALEKA